MNERIKVILGLYSGMENPAFDLSEDQTKNIIDKLKVCLAKKTDKQMKQPRLGEYYGIRLEIPDKLVKDHGVQPILILYSGLISSGSKKQRFHFPDSENIERELLAIAYDKGYEKPLKQFKAPGP